MIRGRFEVGKKLRSIPTVLNAECPFPTATSQFVVVCTLRMAQMRPWSQVSPRPLSDLSKQLQWSKKLGLM